MLVLELACELLAPADRVWEEVRRGTTLRELARPLVFFRGGDGVPVSWREGEAVRVRPWLLGLLPLWRQRIEIARLDGRDLVLETRESGGPLRRWDHRITIEQTMGPRCLYTDRIEMEAGLLGPLLWFVSLLFFLHRQRRLRRLARSL